MTFTKDGVGVIMLLTVVVVTVKIVTPVPVPVRVVMLVYRGKLEEGPPEVGGKESVLKVVTVTVLVV